MDALELDISHGHANVKRRHKERDSDVLPDLTDLNSEKDANPKTNASIKTKSLTQLLSPFHLINHIRCIIISNSTTLQCLNIGCTSTFLLHKIRSSTKIRIAFIQLFP